MKGISVPMAAPLDQGLFFPITLVDDVVRIRTVDFERSAEASDELLEAMTDEILDVFADAEDAVNRSGELGLEEQECTALLTDLAKWGSRAFRTLFSDEEAKALLRQCLPSLPGDQPSFRPTFISPSVAFPWELLFDGGYSDPEPARFWGLRYAPGRVLDVRRDNFLYASEQALPSNMLFCLHEQLRQAHEHEWPQIEQLIRASAEGKFLLLHEGGDLRVTNGETLLTYLDSAVHNMVHFACHCRQLRAGSDALEVSLVGQGAAGESARITLETYTFMDNEGGAFVRQPLVFLNACQAAGGPDNLRKVFNLPGKFVARGAGAVIATACPVPDRFAAAFARQFYRLFLSDERLTIGEALRQTRWHFLNEYNNPLGLAYGLYTPAHYRVATPPAGTGDLL